MGGRGSSSSGGVAAGSSGAAGGRAASVKSKEQETLTTNTQKGPAIKMSQQELRMSDEKLIEQFKTITDEKSTYTVVVGKKSGYTYDSKVYIKTSETARANFEIDVFLQEKPGRIIEREGKMPRQEFEPDIDNNRIVAALEKAGVRRV